MKDEVIKRVFRQHTSLVTVVPLAVRKLLGIKQGDYVFFTWSRGRKCVRFGKVELRKGRSNGDKRYTNRSDRGGRVCAEG